MNKTLTSLFFATLILAAAGGMALAEREGFYMGATDRIFGVILGIIVAWYGNLLPKRQSGVCGNCNEAEGLGVRRFAGVVFTIAGLVHASVWLFAPLDMANGLAMIAVGTALGAVILRSLLTKTFA